MKIAVFYVCVIFVFSCTMYIPKKQDSFRTIITDTSVTHNRFNELYFSKKRCEEFNLPLIHNGVDSFELRIWTNSIFSPKTLIILRYATDKWIAAKYSYFKGNNVIDSEIITNIPIPKDIDKVPAFLSSPDVLNLPSQMAIPNFVDNIGDGQSCMLEISTPAFYKALDYHCPEFYVNDPYDKKFMSIVNFLNSYFNFYVPYCKKLN